MYSAPGPSAETTSLEKTLKNQGNKILAVDQKIFPHRRCEFDPSSGKNGSLQRPSGKNGNDRLLSFRSKIWICCCVHHQLIVTKLSFPNISCYSIVHSLRRLHTVLHHHGNTSLLSTLLLDSCLLENHSQSSLIPSQNPSPTRDSGNNLSALHIVTT